MLNFTVSYNKTIGEYELWCNGSFMFSSSDGLAVLKYKKMLLAQKLEVAK